jgi:hypothetical protein
MRQAIETKFIGPTNHRGSRIKASAQGGSITVSYDHALNSEQNHTVAAHALATKLGWDGVLIGGGNAKGNGNVYVFAETDAASDEEDRIFDAQGKAVAHYGPNGVRT